MSKNLVIVESPAKAKTIENYLGKGFIVKSSIGHIRDLPKKGGMAIDIENGFKPKYVISDDKKKVVSELKAEVKKAETIWLATDEDREGEAIAWHLTEALGLDKKDTKRIVFHEITKKAITHAVENPRALNQNLVNAQQARRILDRLVGFELSPILWKKIKPGLSAGRVQSVALKLIVEREKEIINFNSVSSFRVMAEFTTSQGKGFKAELPKRLNSLQEAKSFLEKCKSAEFKIEGVEKKPAKKSPSAPFTTSTLQQEASRKLGFSVTQTMMVAQKLYESGKITYMRTDSVNLSNDALSAAQTAISNTYGENYSKRRTFSTKAKGAQEAHEAIRPTDMSKSTIDGESGHQKLYALIWKRTIASQMADAQLDRTTAKISVSTADENFVAKGEVITFDGFMKVYLEGKDDESESEKGMLPPLELGANVGVNEILGLERFSKHPPRYAEASLVKKLEELGIGRPSTYAATISTIQNRKYVIKQTTEAKQREIQAIIVKDGQLKEEKRQENYGAEKGKLFPTSEGTVVCGFLEENFNNIMDYGFTSSVESEFDDIAEGKKVWNEMIAAFYGPFHKRVLEVDETAERASGERLLGEDPKSGNNVYARVGRFGPMVQIGEMQQSDSDPKPKYASIIGEQTVQTITLEQAMELFKLPRIVGDFEGEEVVAAIGRFGPYLRYKGKFTSIKKTDEEDPLTIKLDRAIELIKIKIQADKDRLINNFDGEPLIQVLNGRYGPFVQVTPEKGKKINLKIPKDTEPKSLNREDCLSLLKAQKKK
ncbi:MAG: type I DNA topoisomerase [Flavobacteriales bacterium]|nr:type I DNA topoisomerase [Flavobacteriales bacterium]